MGDSSKLVPGRPPSAPQLLQKPFNSQLIEGSDLTFQVQVTGNPLPSIKWSKDGRPIGPSERISMSYKDNMATLVVRYVTPTDAGVYTLVAENENGRMTCSCDLVIQKSTIYSHQQQQQVQYHQLQQQQQQQQYLLQQQQQFRLQQQQHQLQQQQQQQIQRQPIYSNIQQQQAIVRTESESSVVSQYGSVASQGSTWYPNNQALKTSLNRNKVTEQTTVQSNESIYNRQISEQQRRAGQFNVSKTSQVISETEQDPSSETVYLRHIERPKPSLKRQDSDERYQSSRPAFTANLRNLTVAESERAVFDARLIPIGDPNLKIEWYHNENPLEASSRVMTTCNFGYVTLTLLHISAADAGIYTCRAYNDLGEATTQATLNVRAKPIIERTTQHPESLEAIRHLEDHERYQRHQSIDETLQQSTSPPTFIKPLSNLENLIESGYAHFEAQLSPVNDPTMKVEWYFNGKPLALGSRISTIFSFGYVALNISYLRVEDSGVYLCRAINSKGEAISQATLRVKSTGAVTTRTDLEEQQEFIKKTQELEAYRNAYHSQISEEQLPQEPPCFKHQLKDQVNVIERRTAHFEATLEPTGDPSMRVEWLKDGQPLEASSRINSFFNFGYVALTIEKIELRDAGQYTCIATNSRGSASTSARLSVISKKSIITDVQYEEGWEKIQHLEDHSRYSGTREEEIEIKERPRFTAPLSGPDALVEGKSAHFETRLEPMSDPSMKVEWYFNGRPLTTGHRFKTYFDFGYVALDILYVFPEDNGLFTVKAVNKLGEAILNKQLTIQSRSSVDTSTIHDVSMKQIKYLERSHEEPSYQIDDYSKVKPYFVQQLRNPGREFAEGEKAHLEARIEPVNDPSLSVAWFCNGRPLKTGSRFITRFDFGYISLDITDLFAEDSGEYTVRVTNTLGSAHSSASILVNRGSRVVTASQYPDSVEQIRHLEDHSRYKREEQVESSIDKAPVFTKPLKNVETVEGTNVHLETRLLPSGDNSMKVEWFKNGVALAIGHRFRPRYDFDFVSLDLLGVYAEDSGVYTCKAKNALGEAVTSCNIQIWAKDPSVIQEPQHPEAYQQIQHLEDHSRYKRSTSQEEIVACRPRFLTRCKDVHVREGAMAHFECRIEPVNDPKVKVEWFHNGVQMMVGSRFQPFHDFGYVALNILKCIEEDSGVYTCRITNDLGSADMPVNLTVTSQASIELSSNNPEAFKKIRQLEDYSRYHREQVDEEVIRSGPVFTTAPRSLEISEGERARFECSLSPVGDPNLKVEWYKDGLPVKQGSRFVQIFDFGFVALEIMGAYPEDSGQYTCKAKNAFGEAITSAQLKCHGKKSLITEPQVPESLEAIQALEGHGRRVRAEIEEPVTTQAPVFTSAMKNIELQENGTAHFECRVIPVGDPTLRVEWFQNGMPLLQGSRVRTQHDFGYVALDLSRVLPEDSGTYTCKAINALGQAMTSATLKVTATGSILMDSQFPEGLQKITQLESQQKYVREQVDERPTDSRPVFITALKGPTDLVEGQSGHYECRIEPFPDPTMKVEWFRNGQSLTLGHRFRTMFDFGFAALDILQIIPEDSGEYTIRATNHLGTATSSIIIRVHGKESIIMEPQQPDSIAKIRALEGQSRYYREEVREVEIREKPNFGRPLYNLDNLREGQTAHLEATLTPVNDPSMRVEWFVNGIPIPTGSRFKTMHDFGYVALDVADVVPEDSGIYMCKATNKNGEAVVTCSVRVSGGSAIETGTLHEESLAQIQRLESHYTRPVEAPLPAQQRPVFTKPLQSLEGLKEGQSAHLECRLEPINDPKLRVEWFVNGQSIKTGHRFRTTHDFGYVALDILYTFPEDSGTYICRATNELGEAVTTANVSVTAKKSIYSDTYHPEGLEKIAVLESQGLPQRAEIEDRPISKPVFVSELRGRTDYVEGSSAHFEGRIEPAHDPNLKVEIYHNGKLLGAGSRFHRTFDFGYVALDIMSLVPEDSGTYTVRAFNQLDEARSSITINIKGQSSILLDTLHSSALPKIQYLENPVVAEKIQEIPTFQRPVFTQPLVNLENLAEGGSAHLECRLIPVGDANLKVEWFHNSVPLQTGSRFKTVHDFGYVALDIMYLTAEDAGIYMCKATNQLGEAITSCSLKIKTKATIELESQHPEGLQKIRQLEESNRKVEAYIPEKVYDRPMFISPLVGPNEISEGSPAHFECRVIPSDDPNLTVHWFINGVELKAGSRFAVVNNFGFVSLDIAYAYPEDSGVYMCKAINKAGEAVTSTSLHVKGKSSILSETLHPGAVQKTALLESSANRIPAAIESKPVKAPVFTRHLTSHEMLVEGQNVHIGGAIEPVDDEKLIIKWYKNGQQLTEASRIITRFDFGLVSLDIIGVRPDDSGIYTCRAVNEVGEAVSTCTIKVEGREGLILGTEHPESLQKIRELESYQAVKNEVAEPEFSAPVFITHLNNVELKEGERAHFECRVEPSKDNSLRIEFFKNNKPLQTGSRFSVKNDFGFITLDISACQAEDSGIYTCKATNSKGQAISTGSLKVISKSSIILTPQHPMGPEALEKIQQLEARSGYIAPITSEITYPKPYFVTPLAANFTVQEGRPLHLECRVEPSADPNLTIEWFINGKQLEMGNRFNLVNDFGFVVFDIKDTWDRDSGIYTCKARNAQGEAFTSTTILVVSSETSVIQTTLHPEGQRGLEEIQRLEESLRRKEAILAPEEGRAPVFTSQFKPLSNLTEGEAAHFEATLEPVGDQTMKVEWYHNGKAIKIGHRIRTYYAFGLVLLEIIDLRHEDAGEYICIAINKWGRAEASMTLEIVDRDKGEKPKFTTQLTSQSGLKEGESVHLECNLIPVGDPNLFVKWYHNRVELRESSRIKTLSDFGFVVLDISFAHEEDSGEYVCVATNKYGSDVTRCTLEITGSGGILRDSLQPQSLQAIAELEGMSSKKSKSQITVDATPSAPPKFITQITSLPNLVEGQSAHFEAQLSPANDPYLKVEWFINGRPLPSGHRFRTFYDFGIVILDILDLVAEDSGEYVCKATNKLGTDITRATLIIKARSSVIYDPQLPPEMTSNERILQIEEMRTRRRIDITEEIITEAPRFIKPLENPPKLREGENAHLVAELTPTNDPNLTVSWFKNGISLQASTRIRTIHDFGFVILEISPVYPSDSGVYTCKAVNKYGEAVTTCTIEIQGKRSIILESQLPQGMEGGIEKIAAIEEAASSKISETFLETSPKQAPKFLTQPNDQELPEDAMAHFDCRLIPVTDPTMKVEWFFNGRSLVTGSRVKTISDFGYVILEIAGVYARDSGIYTCKATNAYGEASVSCKLTVKSKQSIILEPQLPQQFITGTESIQKLEESLWRTPEMIYDKEKSMPPKFVTHIRDMEKSEGESAHFECRLEPVGDPYLKIEWYVNGVLLLTGSRIRTVNDFGFIVLEIDWLLPRDTGEYLCKATNKHGTDITRAVLKVKSKRDIIIDPQLPPEFSVDKLKQLDMRARSEAIEEDAKIQAPRFITQIHSLENLMEGDSAHFECKLLPVDDPNLRVEWYHNGKPLISGHRFKTTHDFGFVALDILYVHPEDSGEYIARAVNLIGEDITRAIIRCRARQKIIYNPQLPKEMESGIQKIAQIESSRQRYETTSAPDGTERCPPMFVMKPEPLTVLEGEWAKFCCRVVGYPRPRVMWVLNGNTVINGSRYRLSYDGIYHLDIPRPRQYDGGKIEVYARNILGEAHCWTTLDVRPRNSDYRAVLKHSPRPWYDYDITRYQKERIETELDKVFEEKLTPGGTESEVWRTEETDDERIKVKEYQKNQEAKPEIKKYTTEAVYANKQAIQEAKPQNQSNVSWMAKSYQSHVQAQSHEPINPESMVHGKEIFTKQQKQIQKEIQGDLEITRKIRTTETVEQEHKGVTKERRVIGPPRKTRPPEFTKKIQPVRVYEGDRATFECTFVGEPIPTLTWYRENFEIQNSRDFQIETTENKSSLTIREVYLEDSGVFSVKAENTVGSAKSSANLVVEERKDHKSGAVPPSFTKTIEDTRAKTGELVRFDARVIGTKPLDVYWLKNGNKIIPGLTHKMIDDEDQNTLLILEAVPEDTGTYECVAINQVGEARCQAKLRIEGTKTPSVPSTPTTPASGKEKPPMLTEPLKDLVVNEGESATFKCKINGVTASQVAWYKGDSLIKQSRYFRMGHERDAFTLKISEAFPEDDGTYKCIASNSLGSVTTSAKLKVIVPESLASAPNLSPLQDLTIPVGTPARFVTSLSGWPTPNISWFKDGQLIQPSRDFQMFQDNASCSLVIRQVYPEDSGIYICRATNESGQAETSARLIVDQSRK